MRGIVKEVVVVARKYSLVYAQGNRCVRQSQCQFASNRETSGRTVDQMVAVSKRTLKEFCTGIGGCSGCE